MRRGADARLQILLADLVYAAPHWSESSTTQNCLDAFTNSGQPAARIGSPSSWTADRGEVIPKISAM